MNLDKRLVKIGDLKCGKKNNICDVQGVLVGHCTIENNKAHTGVTAVLAHGNNIFKEKVVAGSYAFNGFGKSIGLLQVDEMGSIETPILLTNTLCVGRCADALVSYMLENNDDICVKTSTVNPIVMECNDGNINEIRNRVIEERHIFEAISNASDSFEQGNVGAGTGMVCHGFKGGIGSSSRIVSIGDKEYTLGVLLNSNFGVSNGEKLIFKGKRLGALIKDYNLNKETDKGSIIVIIATDAPLDSRQLKRVAKRAQIGIGRTGSYGGNGSGDIMLAFSTSNKIKHYEEHKEESISRIHDSDIEIIFKATVEATEEAVLNSMLYSKGVKSYKGIYYKSLTEYKELYEELLEDTNL